MKKILIFIISKYQSLSPLLTRIFGGGCRFQPTCGEYTKTAIIKYGVSKGILMGIKRISSCHPWGKFGYDPVQ